MNQTIIDQTGITAAREFLRRHAPFDQMAATHVEFLAKRLRLAFYALGEAITSPEQGPANRLFIIKQGRIRGEVGDDTQPNNNAWALVTGECFPIGALLSRRPVRTTNRAVEDSYCSELDRQDFDAMFQQSAVFQDFCTRRIASLLDNALRDVQAHSATRVSESNSLSTPLRNLIQREPINCSPETSVADVLHIMDRERIGSMVVVDPDHHPIGVFTRHDVLLPSVSPSCITIGIKLFHVRENVNHPSREVLPVGKPVPIFQIEHVDMISDLEIGSPPVRIGVTGKAQGRPGGPAQPPRDSNGGWNDPTGVRRETNDRAASRTRHAFARTGASGHRRTMEVS